MSIVFKISGYRARHAAAALAVALVAWSYSNAQAQSDTAVDNAPMPSETTGTPPSTKQPKINREIAEARRLIEGPAGLPECVWVGRRIVTLLWRDDLDTAALHRQLYVSFKCPPSHIQKAFRCMVRQGDIDPKASKKLSKRVHNCWVRPDLEPAEAALKPAKDPTSKAKATE